MSRLPIVDTIIVPNLDKLLPSGFNTVPALAMMYSIGRQESRFATMVQKGGPAVGFWQFEGGPMSGTAQVLTHSASRMHAVEVCGRLGVQATRPAVYAALRTNVALGVAFARLLLYTDAHRLPVVSLASEDEAWNYYVNNWHPGAPHRQTWGGFWKEAVEGLVG